VAVTYNEIKYSMPVLAGAVLEVTLVAFDVDFVEAEVTSVVDGFADVEEVLDDEVLDGEAVDDETVVELVVDVATRTHWPAIIVSRATFYGFGKIYCGKCLCTCTRSPLHM
jgi:hypothetical protein